MKIHCLVAGLIILTVGCSPQSKDDYSEAGQAAKTAAGKTGDALSRDASQAAGALSDSAAEVKRKADLALVTGKVRNAI